MKYPAWQPKTPPTFRDVGKGKITKQAPKQNHSSLFSPLKGSDKDTVPSATHCHGPFPDVASNTAATEAGGKVPALCVHRALVSVVGARLPGIRVVAENLLGENTAHQ